MDTTTVSLTPEKVTSAPVLTATGIEKSYRRGWLRRRPSVLRGAEVTLYPGELAADAGGIARSGQLGYCPQEPLVYGRLSCDEHFDLFGHAYGMRSTSGD